MKPIMTMKTISGRELPNYIDGYGLVKPFQGAFNDGGIKTRSSVELTCVPPGDLKVLESLEEALDKLNMNDGMTISFHHHLRNGDHVLNMVVEALAKRGLKDLTIAASSIFPVHAPLVEHMKSGVVTGIVANYMSGPVPEAISRGELKKPAIMQTHGGRARAIESGDLHIDVAFIAAPTSDTYGNINGVYGKSACGTLGYAVSDAEYAAKTIVITDNLVPFPACPIEISQIFVDYVVRVESIGDPKGIVSGTTKITNNPVALIIAKMAAEVIKASGLVRDGMSFQTGAGGTSLAVAAELKRIMKHEGAIGSFASGGITGYLTEMLEEGLFRTLFDVQCFDLAAIESYRNNPRHQFMSASMYGNPHTKGAVVNNLDIMILGATEIDTDFNVNVTTGSDGVIIGGSGGHSDTAAGAKLAIVVTNLMKARLPMIKAKVTTITTPGESIDVVVTERGIAVNPRRVDLMEKLSQAKLPLRTIGELKTLAEQITGVPKALETSEKIVAVVEYRDGSVIDVVRMVIDNGYLER
ncbi:citrate (pro-3S)-lyase, alpha subunit [Candidatus Desulfosporosinus infrequens]|uniref:Citrate lyase alpha chain n=1 Tax=Candidatus Desulfosporosinus infrequens TaxID=2043169 RepID=A0A2U3JZR1_9FIRM|nr:citrate (pro-3S)-lyase, alpha subunit [Candidatus Desulfosporosinus infrequens]